MKGLEQFLLDELAGGGHCKRLIRFEEKLEVASHSLRNAEIREETFRGLFQMLLNNTMTEPQGLSKSSSLKTITPDITQEMP